MRKVGSEVARVLEACPFLHHSDLTFWSEHLEEFSVSGETTRNIFFTTHGLRSEPLSEIIRICQALAGAFGPVTLIDAATDERAEIAPGLREEQIAFKPADDTA